MKKEKTSCGIDFGTSNSSAAIAKDGENPTLVNVEGNSVTIPSAIFFSDHDNFASFGREAMNHYMQGEHGRFMRSLKRVLGTDLMSAGTQVNDKTMRFENIIAHFIWKLKSKIDETTQTDVESVIMGRPVHFRDNDPKGDIKAQDELHKIAKFVGFKNIEFQFEPIAAAFAHEARIKKEKLACVVDIGGGTSDFTIIRLGQNLINKQDRKDDILASTGVRIGGNDFDKQLSVKSFMPEFGLNTTYGNKNLTIPNSIFFDLSEWSHINSMYSYKSQNTIKQIFSQSHDTEKCQRLVELVEKEYGHRLLSIIEETKITITDKETADVILSFLSDKPTIKANKFDFEDSIKDNTIKVSKSVEDCLKLAKVKPENIELIILTGGSTEIPYIQKAILEKFPNAELSQENKLSSVGLGLAYDSARRF